MSDPLYRQPGAYVALAESDKTMVVVVYALFLGGYLTAGLTTLIGLVMAYVLDAGASPVAQSHYLFLRRTFWLGLFWTFAAGVVAVVGVIFSITVIGLIIGVPLLLLAKLIGLAALIWYGVRCVVGLLAALADRPYGAPRSLLI